MNVIGIGDDVTLAARIADYLRAQVGHAVAVGTVRRFPVEIGRASCRERVYSSV